MVDTKVQDIEGKTWGRRRGRRKKKSRGRPESIKVREIKIKTFAKKKSRRRCRFAFLQPIVRAFSFFLSFFFSFHRIHAASSYFSFSRFTSRTPRIPIVAFTPEPSV